MPRGLFHGSAELVFRGGPAGAAGKAASVARSSVQPWGQMSALTGSPEPSAPPHRASGLSSVKGGITATTSRGAVLNELLGLKVLD